MKKGKYLKVKLKWMILKVESWLKIHPRAFFEEPIFRFKTRLMIKIVYEKN